MVDHYKEKQGRKQNTNLFSLPCSVLKFVAMLRSIHAPVQASNQERTEGEQVSKHFGFQHPRKTVL